MISGFGMMAIESPAFALKVVKEKSEKKQSKRNDRLVNGQLLK